jgi:hypothetical protein
MTTASQAATATSKEAVHSQPIIWERGRRNMALQAARIMWPEPSWPTTRACEPGSSLSKFTPVAAFPGDALPR